MAKAAETGETCPVARCVAVIGDRWSLLIVRDAFDGTRRFGDFQRSLGMARNILSDRLRKLVQAGILATRDVAAGGAYREYVLTAAGLDLFALLVALRQWGERHLYASGEQHSQLIDLRNGAPLPYMTPLDSDGRALDAGHTAVKKTR